MIDRTALRPPPLPHEHGAWVMLGTTAAFGLAAAPAPGAAAWLAVPGLLLLFLARYAVLPVVLRLTQGKSNPRSFLLRRLGWGGAYIVLAGLLVAVALALAPEPSRRVAVAAAATLLGCGTLQAGLALAGRDRTAWGELIGMAGLAAGGPLLASCGGAAPGLRIAAPGLLALAYFVSSLVLVREYRAREGREREAAMRSLAAHAALAAGLAAATLGGLIDAGASLAFAVVIARAVWAAAHPAPSLRALGMRELAVATLFVVCGVAGLRHGIA